MKSGAILKSRAMLAATILGSLSLPLLAQQPAAFAPAQSPATSQAPAAQAPTSQVPATQAPAATSAPVADLRPVQVELEQKLDSKTAKNGDSVVAQTRSAVKTADGTEIPKGSKLTGHILAVQPSNGANAQVALKFDQVEIKGGQSLPVQSQIQSITPAGSAETASAAESPMSAPQPSAAAGARAGSAMQPGAQPGASASASPSTAGSPAAAASGPPAAGTVVAQNGGINIVTTAVPGVLLANNAPGQQDPRMARVSSILLGARRDIQLDSGTHMVVAIASAGQ
ncbi:MAG TPA: hypothetical protein VL346_04840 [Acidobacteriaceae bacterium]|nr:hypothetical protein [Acidobacteriaceae bacterium]